MELILLIVVMFVIAGATDWTSNRDWSFEPNRVVSVLLIVALVFILFTHVPRPG